MTRHVLMLLLAAVGTAGCTTTYRVHVNTFSQFKEPLNKGDSIYVAVDPKSRNPILADRIAARIRTMLQDLGYNAAEKPEDGRYILTFRAGVNASNYLDYTPVPLSFGGYYGPYGYPYGFGWGYTAYVPYIETVYAHWLDTRLYSRGDILTREARPLWIGEAVVGRDNPELRQAINYLLVGLMEYFGAETQHWVTVKLKRDDPRVLAVEGTP